MTIHLLRHGRTEANDRRIYCGATDISLSEGGLNALKELRESLSYPDITELRAYTSGLLRTQETLHAIYGDVEFVALPGLNEMNFGRFEMHGYDELKNDAEYISWITDETGDFVCPGGESSNIFKQRIFEIFSSIASSGDNAMIVCHGGVIAQLMAGMFPDAGRNFYEWQPSAGRGYSIHFENGIPTKFEEIPC